MFARAVSAPRPILVLLAALVALSGCGGGERQDADEPEGTYRLEVADAAFPERQGIAERTTMRIRVRNPEQRTVPNVAVIVETAGAKSGDGVTAFGQKATDSRLADTNRPIWIVDEGPVGGTSAYSNTWTLGPLRGGQTKTFEWKVTPVKPGRHEVTYKVSAGLDGKAKARLTSGGQRPEGTFTVQVSRDPAQSRVDPDTGEVVRRDDPGTATD